MKAGTARTNIVNLATALHREALAMELHRTPGWTSRIFKSIVRWPENTSLWQQWEAMYTDLADPRYKTAARKFYDATPPGDGRRRHPALARGRGPLHADVHAGRERADGVRAEKQNSPVNPELCEWPESYFDETCGSTRGRPTWR